MKRASYRDAIDWVAQNDCPGDDGDPAELVSACLVADIFGVSREKVGADVARLRKKLKL